MSESGSNPSQKGEGVDPPTVLIVDDNPIVTRALARILADSGYRTEVFHSGGDALSYLERAVPDAALIDIHLPDISGLVLSSKVRERLGPQRPIIVLSGDTSMENLRSLPHVGATYFISKPFKPEYMLERLRELV